MSLKNGADLETTRCMETRLEARRMIPFRRAALQAGMPGFGHDHRREQLNVA
jgi:hypothetical protein